MATQMFDLKSNFKRYHYSDESISIIENENLLPVGLLKRLHHFLSATFRFIQN